MAPILFEETDVFKFAHSRMKKLMTCCTLKVDHTDFTSWSDLEQLLRRLEKIFFELIAHEQIENQFVMKKLKIKLKENALLNKNELVCNCHKDDRFTPLMNLFRDGYSFIRRANADRIFYQIKLHKAISQFYQDFVPHMLEEENDIQPLLLKYFTDMELKLMRIDVIRMTLKRRDNPNKNNIERSISLFVGREKCSMADLPDQIIRSVLQYLTNDQIKSSCLLINRQWNECANKVIGDRSKINQLSDEILLRLFNYYFTRYDLLRSCLTVNRRWFNLIRDRTIWRTINPINWSRNQWNKTLPIDTNEKFNDFDIDQLKEKEIRILSGFQRDFLPNFGYLIEKLILYGSLTLKDNQARILLSSCPNVKHLNLGRTLITGKTFLQYRWFNKLEEFLVEDCHFIDDQLFVNVKSSTKEEEEEEEFSIEDKEKFICEKTLLDGEQIEDRCFSSLNKSIDQQRNRFPLKHLNISNCYQISDQSFRSMIEFGFLKNLRSIDLSGCLLIKSESIELLLESSVDLQMESSFFCNNHRLSSDKFSLSNSCRNVDNPSLIYRFCSC